MVNEAAPPISIHTRQARALETDIAWLWEVLSARMSAHFKRSPEASDPLRIPAPELDPQSHYGRALIERGFSKEERLILCLALAVHLKPQLLDIFFTRNATFDRPFTEFGGHVDEHQRGFLPTQETALFLLAGEGIEQRLHFAELLDPTARLMQSGLLAAEHGDTLGSRFSGRLSLSPEALDRLLYGRVRTPAVGPRFPARALHTQLDFDELVLDPNTLEQVLEIRAFIDHGETLLGTLGLGRTLKPGFRSLFHGPSGTGKTLTAALLGKLTERPVYRIDLSMVVSKYIGETEKNLEQVFARAENHGWLLFFDEADALFGKRSAIHDAHDRYANQEVSYLLQRVEDYPNVVILASNMKENLDPAFVRRFQSIIHFPLPSSTERLRLWRQAFSPRTPLADDVDLGELAEGYDLSGGAITNVVRFATLRALARGSTQIRRQDVLDGVRREFQKAGKTL